MLFRSSVERRVVELLGRDADVRLVFDETVASDGASVSEHTLEVNSALLGALFGVLRDAFDTLADGF